MTEYAHTGLCVDIKDSTAKRRYSNVVEAHDIVRDRIERIRGISFREVCTLGKSRRDLLHYSLGALPSNFKTGYV
jgi:hypothetical protein